MKRKDAKIWFADPVESRRMGLERKYNVYLNGKWICTDCNATEKDLICAIYATMKKSGLDVEWLEREECKLKCLYTTRFKSAGITTTVRRMDITPYADIDGWHAVELIRPVMRHLPHVYAHNFTHWFEVKRYLLQRCKDKIEAITYD